MASVFKLGRDKKKRRSHWYFEFVDHDGKKRMRKGFVDKALTEQLAAKCETEARLRKLGLVDGEQAALAEGKKSDISVHLSDYERHLSAKKNTAKHVSLTMGRIRRIISGAGIKTLGALAGDDVERFLYKLQQSESLGHRTFNHYLQSIEGFCLWLVKKRRLGTNPVADLERLNAATDVRRRRRALSTVEFAALMGSAQTSTELIQCYDGPTRARIYLFSYMTGLRRGELASLSKQSFNLEGMPPTLEIKATISKHRRKDVLPLHEELAAMLRSWLPELEADEPLFPQLARRRTSLMVKKDLERAGIPYENEQGIADFHAAGRHTHITELLRSGASLVEARQLARHSDVNMTMRYTHIGIDDQAKALRGLPVPPGAGCQDIVRKPCISDCREASSAGDDWQNEAPAPSAVTPDSVTTSDSSCQEKTPPDSGGVEWRRRESNVFLSRVASETPDERLRQVASLFRLVA
jgi:integrase